jgi:hypothetical protein
MELTISTIMKKVIFSLLLISSAIGSMIAQDAIIKRNGDEIKAKVKAVNNTEIEYVRYDNLEGPLYKIAKSDVLLIMYSNGTKDIFSNETTAANNNISNTASNDNNVKKVRPIPSSVERPAQRYYNYDLFDKSVPLVFLGIDFYYTKLIGDKNFEDPKKLFSDINTLFVTEKNKYDVRGPVRKAGLTYQYSIVEKRNESVVENVLTNNTEENISFSDLQNIVDEYDLNAAGIKDGLALVMICENLNAVRGQASYYYVVFDVVSKKIVLSDRIIGAAGGSGPRNYWARSVYETLSKLQNNYYGRWKVSSRK